MPFEIQIALRYLLAKRRQVFISVISLVSTAGVTVGVMALIIALALMTGLQQEMRDRILGATAHVYVFKPGGIDDYRAEVERIRQVPGVIGAAPAVMGMGLMQSERGEKPVTLKGIDPVLEPQVTDIARAAGPDALDALSAGGGDFPGILIGRELAGNLGAFSGDVVTLVTAQGTLTPMGMLPRHRRLKITGTFQLGFYEFDQAWGYATIETVSRVMGKDRIDHIEVRVADAYAAPRIADDIQTRFGTDYITQDWTTMNQTLYSALWLEKIGMGIGIGLIVMVAALNIVASLVLIVMEKTRDIAILKTMGASSRSVMLIFLLQGLIIGTIGTIAGSAAGVAATQVLDRYQLIKIPSEVYQVTYLPFKLLPWDFTVVVIGAVIVCFLATLYPSRQAAKLDPAQALRYE